MAKGDVHFWLKTNELFNFVLRLRMAYIKLSVGGNLTKHVNYTLLPDILGRFLAFQIKFVG